MGTGSSRRWSLSAGEAPARGEGIAATGGYGEGHTGGQRRIGEREGGEAKEKERERETYWRGEESDGGGGRQRQWVVSAGGE